ncbi:MAG TPA: hypothetical protein VKV32_03825, partial [Stellaceae bacterium]|nr:hypothetical protein [Stellaceae bacterium]
MLNDSRQTGSPADPEKSQAARSKSRRQRDRQGHRDPICFAHRSCHASRLHSLHSGEAEKWRHAPEARVHLAALYRLLHVYGRSDPDLYKPRRAERAPTSSAGRSAKPYRPIAICKLNERVSGI